MVRSIFPRPNSVTVSKSTSELAPPAYVVGIGAQAANDLFSVALHEAGHAFGLGDTTDPTSVLYQFYSARTGLSQTDVTMLQSLYGALPQLTLGRRAGRDDLLDIGSGQFDHFDVLERGQRERPGLAGEEARPARNLP